MLFCFRPQTPLLLVVLLHVSAFSATPSFSNATPINETARVYQTVYAAADFNGDGKLDLACASFTSDTAMILIGDNLGNFEPLAPVATGNGPVDMVIGDFNKDTYLDLVTVNQDSNDISILLGNGNGTFQAAINIAIGGTGRGIAVGNFDEDPNGYLDLAVTCGTSILNIFLGNGNGTFQSPVTLATGSYPGEIAVSDYNKDGHSDLAIVNNGSNNVGVFLGTGTGTFAAAVNYAVGSFPITIVAADFNKDGNPDLAVGNIQSDTVSMLLGTVNGTFGAATNFAVSDPRGFAVADVNKDNNLDLISCDNSGYALHVLLGNGSGGLGSANTLATTEYGSPSKVLVADFDSDSNPDLICDAINATGLRFFKGYGDNSYAAPVIFGDFTNPYAVATGDFNNDGKTDVVSANFSSDSITIFPGRNDGTFGAGRSFAAGTDPYYIVASDFNGDGKLDVAVANYIANGTVSILLGNNDLTFSAATAIPVGSYPEVIAVADFNHDGKADLAVANGASFTIGILLGVGDGTFQPQVQLSAGSAPVSIAAADLNSDGHMDLVFAKVNTDNVGVLLGNGNGTFGAATNYNTGDGPYSVAVADFNGDDIPDVATANTNSNNASVLLGTGSGSFLAPVHYSMGSNPKSIAIGDFDADGNADVAVANISSTYLSVRMGTGTGTLGSQITVSTGGQPRFVACSMINTDVKPDLMVANGGGNNIVCLLNTTPFPSSQTITFNPLDDKIYGDASFQLSATASSGLAVSFGIQSGPATILNGILTITGAGTVKVRASQAGNSNYAPAPDVFQSFAVAKADQTITFNNLPDKTIGDPDFSVSATVNTGLPLVFSISSGPATINPMTNIITLTGSGLVTVKVSQSGNANYNSAFVEKSFTVNKKSQTVSFGTLAGKTFGDTSFTVSATATSGLAPTFSIASGPATINGSTITITGAGVVTVLASQGGDATWDAAPDVMQSFTVGKATASVTLNSLSAIYDGNAQAATATTNPSGKAVDLTYNGFSTIPANAGIYLVVATINDANYQGTVSGVLVISKATPVITWAEPVDIISGNALSDTQLNATANVTGNFTYNPPLATMLKRGSAQLLTASFTPADSTNYLAATATILINVLNAAPTLLSQPTFFPAEPEPGVPVTFVASGSDLDNDALLYNWAFGDGTSGFGATAIHNYSAPDTYSATLTITDSQGGSTSATLSLTVIAKASPPGAADSDGDGFTDAIEIAAGSSASNSLDTPLGVMPAANSLPLADAKLSIKLNFAKPGSDAIGLSGTVLLPDGFSVSGAKLLVDIGGVAKSFTLSAKGSVKAGNDSAAVKSKGTAARTAKFAVKLSKGDFDTTLSATGLDNADVTKDVNVPLTIVIAGNVFQKQQLQMYKAKAGKSGVTKDRK